MGEGAREIEGCTGLRESLLLLRFRDRVLSKRMAQPLNLSPYKASTLRSSSSDLIRS